MEDEDVDSVNTVRAPVVENCKTDSSLDVSDELQITASENDSSSRNEEGNIVKVDVSSNIERLKSTVNKCVDRFNEIETSNVDFSDPSPKKVNGEIYKNESPVPSEESCNDEKKEDENVECYLECKVEDIENSSEGEEDEHVVNDSESKGEHIENCLESKEDEQVESYIKSEEDENIEEDLKSQEDENIEEDLKSQGDENVEEDLKSEGDENIEEDLKSEGDENIEEDLKSEGDENIEEDLKIQGDENVEEDLKSQGDENIEQDLKSEGDENFEEDLKSKEVDADSCFKESNKRKSSSDRSDVSNDSENESDSGSTSDSSPVEFRGFKRRKILESRSDKLLNICRKVNDKKDVTSSYSVADKPEKPKSVELRRSARHASIAKRHSSEAIISVEEKVESGDQLTEYAQYLGLQPTVKFKCGRCGEKHFQSMASLNAHQMVCCKTASSALVKQTKPPSGSNLSTNFRITRKVYLCSACGTYYENWKLFLHMRDMHKRHICLFCLGMFSVAERLAEHLLYQHNVHEKACKSPEEFLSLFKSSCYLTCCSCEKMFTERDDFCDHQCKESASTSVPNWNDSESLTQRSFKVLAQKCNLCGVRCGHYRTCPNIAHKFQQNAQLSSLTNSTNPSNSSSNSINQEILKQALSLSDSEKDYYDVSNAASFCHVDIANDSDNQTSPEKAGVEKLNVNLQKCPDNDSPKSPLRSPGGLEKTAQNDQEEQADNSKPLPNNSENFIADSVADESDTSDVKHDISTCPQNDDTHFSDEDSNKENNEDHKMTIDEMSIEEMDTSSNVVHSLEKQSDEDLPEEKKPNAGSDVNETLCANDNTVDDKDTQNGISLCYVKLDRITDNDVSNFSRFRVDREEDGDSDLSNWSGESSYIESSNRNNLNINLNDDAKNNVSTSNEPEEIETVASRNKDNSLESSLNNEERCSLLSKEGNSDNRFENNRDLVGESDGNETDHSNKFSILNEDHLCDDNCKEETNDENVPADNEIDETESVHEDMETDTTKQIDGNCEDSRKNATSIEEVDNDVAMEESENILPPKDNSFQCDGVSIQLASEEVMAMALTLEDKMNSLNSQSVIKECVRTSCTTCSYCSHAIKIGVNGKQLAVHLLTEHRYMPVKNETVDDIIERLKTSLDELQDVWFNTDSYDSSDKTCFVPYDHTYECFQCNYVANTHKDLFSHKRKVHQKTILYCSMCKESFYSYSELLCHMCPGLYDAAKNIQFRCCLCTVDRLPSAFRLMVHLRKSHNTCDICLEVIDDQQKLSTHMVKHKLHHLCYRCGIAYRNKPDITKHLFWKHGTESVLCKKCLQKKWPHVYHFCIPPNSFICEECNLSFSRAVYLKVHKRFHNNNLPYVCNSCEQKFVSKKLLIKHGKIHEAVPAEETTNNTLHKAVDVENTVKQNDLESRELAVSVPEESTCAVQHTETSEKPDETLAKPHKKKSKRDKEKKAKPVVDVYDLPPLNLSSESDDTDDERETRSVTLNNVDDKERDFTKPNEESVKTPEPANDDSKIEAMNIEPTGVETKTKPTELNPVESVTDIDEIAQPVTVVDGIWDNFHTYKAEQEKRENLDIANKQSILSQLDPALPPVVSKDSVLGDHDYCLPNNVEETEKGSNEADVDSSKTKSNEHSSSIDHDYCTQNNESLENNNNNNNTNPPVTLNTSNQTENTETPPKKKQKSPKKKTKQHNNSSSSSDSSSDSDSSSCSCGTNCSCSSSSSNSSSSSSSDSDSSSSDGRNNSTKREKKKDRLKNKRKGEVIKPIEPVPPPEEPVANVLIEPEEPLIKESDLETDETATDEEFYDKYPQMQANQILAEKRNQLMLLATVAPTVNNGTASPPVPNSNTNINLDQISSPQLEIVTPPVKPVVQPQSQSKKKVKTKKRRKSSLGKNRSANKHNLAYDTPQPSTSFTPQWQPSGHGKKANDISPLYMQSPVQSAVPATNLKSTDYMVTPPAGQKQKSHHRSGSSDTSSSKRFSKRRRVRNKFYGYSSDEDGEHHQTHPPIKWKKVSSVDGSSMKQIAHQQQQFYSQPVNTMHPEYNHHYQQQTSPTLPPVKIVQPSIRSTFEENQINNSVTPKRAAMSTPISSDSVSDSDDADSDSDSNRLAINQQLNTTSITTAGINTGATEKDDKLYCYCQCPYDEVSEMIACDGVDCTIEWFHFECVGIMVPPKGKWYCPDCRKRRGLS